MKYLTVLAMMGCSTLLAQPNCNVYKLEGNETCYQACMIATQPAPQGSKLSQENFDRAINLCPTLDYAYFEKAVPYLKRGDFVTWKKLIDRAVELNPQGHLGYRGWCRYQFLRDYKGAIEDIERLESMGSPDIGYSINGSYHLTVAKALCYKALRNPQKAVTIIEAQLAKKDYSPLPYDFLHLGVAELETGDIDNAIKSLLQSIEFNDYLAEAHFYLSKAYLLQGDRQKARAAMEKAKAHYLKGYRLFDFYTHPMDKVFLSDIDEALAVLK